MSPPNNIINLRGFVNGHLPYQPGQYLLPGGASQQKAGAVLNSFTLSLQNRWSGCQYCTYSISGSHTGRYWRWVMEQTHYVFGLSSLLRFVYFIVCTPKLYFISPLPFHAPGSTVILCSFTHLFPSSLLMLPVVHRRTGPAPKRAESQWWCQSSVELQSHLNLSTTQPLSAFLSLCFHSLLQMYFLISFPSLLYKILLCCLFFLSPTLPQPVPGILNRSNTQPWLLLPFPHLSLLFDP